MPNTINALAKLFERDLNRLSKEITHYHNIAIWDVHPGIINSGGNLCLHICGNLRFFIGAVLGGSGYQRDRDFEFNGKGLTTLELLKLIDLTKEEILTTFQKLDHETLSKPFPIEVLGYRMTCEYFLLHLYGHFNYHLGQINYHRRSISNAQD